ncbi:cutinase, partial [Lecanoromycetidae sp. Uapishka_2]
MKPTTFLPLFALVLQALSSPAPARVQERNTPSATKPVATVTSGFTGIPPTALPTNCANIVLTGATDNDIINGICKDFTLIFARGTTENGNIGDIVGPPFVAALTSMLGSSRVAVQGVNNYPADIAGFLAGGSATGSQDMAELIAQTMQQCPHTKLCVGGYSQGAQVAHNAANMITQAQTDFINSVVLYGDPDDGEAFGEVPASKVSTDCHLGDDICLHGDLILPPHLDYCLDVTQEAAFAVQKSGL